jgi:hypothetical protein
MIELHLLRGLSVQLREDTLTIQVSPEAVIAADPTAGDLLLQPICAYLARHQILHSTAQGSGVEAVTIPLPRRV